MRALLAMCLASLPAPSSAWADGTVLFHFREDGLLDDAEIVEAVSIYTRDLGLEVLSLAGAPPEVTAESLGKEMALAQSRGARLLFWYQVREETPSRPEVVLYAVSLTDNLPAVHAIRVGPPSTPGLARVIALKVRAVLKGASEVDAPEPAPAPAPALPSALALPRAPLVPAAAPPSLGRTPPVDAAPADFPGLALPAPGTKPRLFLTAGYRLSLPHQAALLRQGLFVDGAVPVSSMWEVHLGVDVSSQSVDSSPAGVATLFDMPVRLGTRLVIRRGALSLAFGPEVALHVLWANGYGSDGSMGSATQAAAGLGADALGRWQVGERLAVEASLSLEDVVPDFRFMLHGVPALDAGGLMATFGLGGRFAAL